MRRLARSAALFLAFGLLAGPALAQPAEYGTTEFANSGAEAAQEPFLRGLLMLHSFEYDDARAAFQEAQAIDPDFAMAHWGEAMTHNHPIWMEQDRKAALQALRDLAPTPDAQLDAAATEREAAYLRTLHVLYGAGNEAPMDKEARDDAYEDAMADLAARYPDDLDAQAFHALSILGTAHEGRDFATYMRAASIVEEVFDANPQHPGAAHYLIHAYDDPVHAPLGLRPARVYADIAPAAPHALHMPSHIFFALGQWARGASSNVDSYRAAKNKSTAADEGLSGGGFHALHWLHYARLQQGRHADARAVLDTTRMHATDSRVQTGYADYMRWYMPVAYVVETEHWDRYDALAEAMAVDAAALDARGAVTLHAGRGLAAAQQGTLSAARSALEKAQSALGEDPSEALRIQVLELEGLIALKAGDDEQALSHLKEATALETDRPLNFGPPFPAKPAPELYGEALLALDRPADALTQFETTLERYPARARSLWGTARAAARADRPEAAQAARSALASQWQGADASVRRQLQSLAGSAEAETAQSR
ncbi:Tfp pilus assembly protein PilF [Salinibacter ruber]|uniref:tetratricopeptide repeat protein n=1 Tax=Salinibacter ruber TaxID=146919 RepID=UPI002167C847|nr:tetratricopeptide repeat protein [Salinibacter ruber]MCS3667513.1 Tfp pilus assembly protein PilF [Salinibacter ruber]